MKASFLRSSATALAKAEIYSPISCGSALFSLNSTHSFSLGRVRRECTRRDSSSEFIRLVTLSRNHDRSICQSHHQFLLCLGQPRLNVFHRLEGMARQMDVLC